MVGFQNQKDALDALGAKVVAISVDPLDKAQEVAAEVDFDIAYAATRADGDRIGAWWEDKRGIIQPSEFVLDASGTVLSATYSSGPVGRLQPEDAVAFITARAKAG